MNCYFKKFQSRESINWDDIVGISNFDLHYRELYSFTKIYLDSLDPENIKFKKLLFYKRKNVEYVDWQKEIPLHVRRLHLENIESINFRCPSFIGLESLHIINCNLKNFPWRWIPVTLRHLNLSKNQLCGHVSLASTKNLRFINLSENRIESVDLPYDCNTADISYNKCKHIDFYNPLMFANFSWNCLTDFKASKWMERCNLSHNNLESVDFSVSLKISDINLSFNTLVHPINFEKCKLLKKLVLSHNRLPTVDGLEYLSELEFIDLSSNQIETFVIPFIRKVNLQNNPLQYFEWLVEPLSKSTSGFSLTEFLNGESQSSNPILNMASGFLQEKLKMNKVDEMYVDGKCSARHAQSKPEKICVNLSKTNIQEFPETMIIQNSNRVNRELHIFFYDNEYVMIPYHPMCHVHIGRMQMHNWKKSNPGMQIKFLQLENQDFYVVDSE